MRIRFYMDRETDRPHVENHGVHPIECVEVLERPGQDFAGQRGARIAIGQTRMGWYLKVVYRLLGNDTLLVITAYPIRGNELAAYRRRLRRRR